ncbi:unnamed protein product [Phaeothamnion confervicola]
MAVKAAQIAPLAFGHHADDSALEHDLQFDLKNLMVTNPHTVDMEALKADKEGHIKAVARDAMQALVGRLFALPSVSTEVGPVATLPAAQATVLPRAKPIPQPKAETRWERFAKEKGIAGRKKERMVWDEDAKEFRPRWGYKRARDGVMDQAIVEVRDGQDPMADPWSDARAAKKARVGKNAGNRAKNQERAGAGVNTKAGIPVDLVSGPTAAAGSGSGKGAAGGGGTAGGAKRGKEATKRALELAQRSTASMGKFDERRVGEPERRVRSTRRKFRDATEPAARESETAAQILRGVLLNAGKSKVAAATATRDSLAAYDAVEGAPDRGAKKKKGGQAVGKFKKVTKKRSK